MKIVNVGLQSHRLLPECNNPRELAFAAAWENENERVNSSGHILASLLYGHGHGRESRCSEECKSIARLAPSTMAHDRVVAAAVIQWLGSNVGFDFLREALHACGYEITGRGK